MSGQVHVVVGAGAVGSRVARLLADQDNRVRLVTRSGTPVPHPQIEPVAADAGDAARLAELSRGAQAIYNCANPPYRRWARDWPPIAQALLSAAEQSGAVLVTTSNLYGYGPVDGPMTEDTPLAATGTKGRIRAQMWLEALAAHRSGRLRATEARGSDYLVATSQSELGDRVVPRLLAGRSVSVLGDPDTVHTWTSTDDMAGLLVRLARDERAWGRAWHVPSNLPRTVREVIGELCRISGVAPVTVRRMSPVVVRSAALFVPLLRELPEVMHQHTRPWVMDSSAAQETFGLHPSDWDEVLRRHLGQYQDGSRAD